SPSMPHRHVQRRVAVEEARRQQLEARLVDRHHRPLLGAREVRDAERVPEDQVLALQRRVAFGPAAETVAAQALVDVVAGGVELRRIVTRYPEVVAEETGSAADAGTGQGVGDRVL